MKPLPSARLHLWPKENTFAGRMNYAIDRAGTTLGKLSREITRRDLATVSESTLSKYATTSTLPTLERAAAISLVLDVDLNWLAGLTDEISPAPKQPPRSDDEW